LSDWFYKLVYAIGWPAFFVNGRPTILHRERAKRKGAYILAPTHFSEYDVALLIKETPRVLDFVSIVEVFRNPLAAWFLGSMGAFPLDRWKPDSPTVRIILDRLRRARVVVMFPEGTVRTEETSVLNGGSIKPGVGRIAQMTRTPIIPCVVLGSAAYRRLSAWMPLKRTRYAINYGEPIVLGDAPAESEPKRIEQRLREAYSQLYRELMAST
jgi:1-acyl-sn-glycerol-3-phosphate acyltransferase